MIVPTVGRIVWFIPKKGDFAERNGQPLAAIVVHVWGDRCVNLQVFPHNGGFLFQESVQLLQDADEKPEEGRYAEWMPYQKGQAAKHQLEGK